MSVEQKESELLWRSTKMKKVLESLPDTGVEPVTSRLKVLRASQLRQSGLPNDRFQRVLEFM
jgi:hypothetical protein